MDLSQAGARAARLSGDLAARLRPGRGGARVVVILGNEGATFVRLTARGIAEERVVPVPDPDGRAAANAILHADPRAPVTVLLDVLEQHYRETVIPRVLWTDRRKLLRRKLAQTYGEDHLTRALYLGVQAPAEGESLTKRRYFLIGVPLTDELRAWLDVVTAAGNPMAGMALLPVEATGLVTDLSTAATPTAETPTWQVLVTRHRASGFRQVILKDGELIFTRLTPGPEPGAEAAEVADNIHGEVRSTMTYLRRLGFTDTDAMDLVVIADDDVGARLDRRQMRTRQLRTLTPAETAAALDLPVAEPAGEAAGTADALVAAWYARRAWPRLRVDTPELRRARVISAVPAAAYALAVLIALAAAGYGGWQHTLLRGERAQLATLQAERADLEAAKAELLAARPTDQPSMRAVALVVNSRRALARATPVHAPVVRGLGTATEGAFVVTAFSAQPRAGRESGLGARAKAALPEQPARPRGAAGAGAGEANGDGEGPDGRRAAGHRVVATATLRYRGEAAERKAIAARFRALRARLAEVLPRHDVRLSDPPFDAAPGAEMSGTAGVAASSADADAVGEVTGTYRITGPVR